MKSPQTLLGHIASVSGATVRVHLVESVASGLAIIDVSDPSNPSMFILMVRDIG